MKDIISLESSIQELEVLLSKNDCVDFSLLSNKWETEIKLIHFLGILELLQLGKITINQKENFGTIVIQSSPDAKIRIN